jgi:hypothetical protein
MALFLDCDTGSNSLLLAPSFNGVYSTCVVTISGILSTNTPGGETINSITVNQGTITVDNLRFDGVPVSFPYTVDPLSATIFSFDITPSGTVGNTDQFKFTFILAPSGSESFTYDVTELDIKNSITIANNTLPLDFGSVEVGSSSLPVSFVINNETCKRCDYTLSSDSGDITFNIGSASLFPRTNYTDVATWTPTSAYDLSAFSILCDTECGQALYGLLGESTEPPVGGAFSRKLIIANSISI